MCLFNESHYKKPLHRSIISFLSDYTTKKDRDEVAEIFGFSSSLMKQVCGGHMNLSKANSVAIKALMERAVTNCGNINQKSKKDGEVFKKIMDRGVDAVLGAHC